jgi:hypothetical protein
VVHTNENASADTQGSFWTRLLPSTQRGNQVVKWTEMESKNRTETDLNFINQMPVRALRGQPTTTIGLFVNSILSFHHGNHFSPPEALFRLLGSSVSILKVHSKVTAALTAKSQTLELRT